MSTPCKIIIARMQPQQQFRLPYLMTRKPTSNLISNEESSLTTVVVVFGLLLVLLVMPMHFLCHWDQMMNLALHTAHQNANGRFQLICPYLLCQIGKAEMISIFFRLNISQYMLWRKIHLVLNSIQKMNQKEFGQTFSISPM